MSQQLRRTSDDQEQPFAGQIRSSWDSVRFEIDVNGILHVTAEDKGTGIKSKIIITNDHSRLSKEDIDRMINNAEKFADDDKKVKELVEAKNEFESYAFSLKTQIMNSEALGGKLSEDDKLIIEKAVEKTITWVESNENASVEELKEQKAALEKLVILVIRNPAENHGAIIFEKLSQSDLAHTTPAQR